jgi:transcription antitermination factor NusA-like protein
MAESDNLKRSGDDLESEQSKKSRTDDSGSFDDVKLTMRVLIDDEQVGALIGKGGQIIKKLRGDTSCRIEIDTTVPDARDRVVTVQGPVPKLPLALSLLANRLKTPPGERERDRGDKKREEEACVTILVDNAVAGGIIGKRGAKVTETRRTSGASIRISQDPLEDSSEKNS